MCPDQLSCLQDIDFQLQTLVPIATTTYTSVTSGSILTTMTANGSAVWLLGFILGLVFIAGLVRGMAR